MYQDELKTIVEIAKELPLTIKVLFVGGGGTVVFSFVLRKFKELGNFCKMYDDKVHYNDN